MSRCIKWLVINQLLWWWHSAWILCNLIVIDELNFCQWYYSCSARRQWVKHEKLRGSDYKEKGKITPHLTKKSRHHEGEHWSNITIFLLPTQHRIHPSRPFTNKKKSIQFTRPWLIIPFPIINHHHTHTPIVWSACLFLFRSPHICH